MLDRATAFAVGNQMVRQHSSPNQQARSRALDSGGQARKGTWGMSRHQEALKGAEDCDKPGETVKQVMIPGFPNRP